MWVDSHESNTTSSNDYACAYITKSPGDEFSAKDSFGSVESVKAASDVYAPISGKVVEVNESLSDEPGLVNSSAEEDAWFIKLELSDESELSGLMSAEQYKDHCEKEAH